jgi:hypothetical protein
MSTLRSAQTAFLLLLAASTVPLIAQEIVGPELVVNQTRAGRQMTPDVGVAADGSFVAVWRDEAAGRVWARRYGANGKPRGGEFRVSRLGDGQQSAVAVGVRPDGSFVVAWNRIQGGGEPVEVYASRFDANGQRVGEPILAGFARRARAEEPAAVAILPDGGFFVVFSREDGWTYWADGDVPSRDLYGRRFTRDGILVGERITLNADPYGDQRHPECEVSQGRELVCTWESQLGEGWFGEIMVRRFDLAGLPLGNELQANEEETDYLPQRYPTLAIHQDGTILVAWLDSGLGEHIVGRVLDATGQFLAPSFTLGTTEPAFGQPRAAATNEGFAVFWTTRTALLMRRVSAAGQVAGAALPVNRRRDGSPWQPAVAFGPGGGALCWGHFTEGFHDADVLVRRLR